MTATRSQLADTLVQIRHAVDAHFHQAMARTPTAFMCRRGCDACCHRRFGVFEVEAEPIRSALAELARTDPALRTRIRAHADDPEHGDRCALLIDNSCAIYQQRPIICRSHGLPVLVEHDDGEHSVEHCPLNFRALEPPRESMLVLEAVNRPLAVLAQLWNESDGGAKRVDLADLARE